MTLRVDPVTNVVDAVSRFDDRLTLPAREKKQLETDLQKLIQEIERDLVQARASIVGGGDEGKLVAAFLATFGDADFCHDCFGRDIYKCTDTFRYFSFWGFAGDRVGRVRGGEKRGKNHAGIRTKATLILDPID